MVLSEIAAERLSQDERWGVQRLADNDGTDDGTMLLGRSYATWARIFQLRCDRLRDEWKAGRGDSRNMTVVLLEEVFEALAEATATRPDPAALRAELVQVAAVAVKWIEIIDHRAVQDLQDRGEAGYFGRARERGLSFDEARALRSVARKAVPPQVITITAPEGLL
jgi:hypothetical protein